MHFINPDQETIKCYAIPVIFLGPIVQNVNKFKAQTFKMSSKQRYDVIRCYKPFSGRCEIPSNIFAIIWKCKNLSAGTRHTALMKALPIMLNFVRYLKLIKAETVEKLCST